MVIVKKNGMCPYLFQPPQENIVIGFSWKTDGTIPQDHPAYHMWQGLSDRRREFSLNPFDTTEVSSALTLFSKELKQPLNTRLKRTLTEHCQGYPWLVKKLCIHVFNLVKNGIEQIDILGQALNVGELFKKELEELPSNELACIKKIATDSPAEFYQIEDTYGGDTLTSLFNKRLVLRSGSRLTLYWDIFRDYVLSGKVPHIPVSYIPQSDVQRYCDVLRILLKEGETTISVIGDSLGMGEGRTDNIVRDLVIIGNAEYKRKTGILTALQTSENEAALVILKFWRSHMLFHTLINSKGSGFVTSQKEIKALLKSLYLSSKFTEKTWDAYLNRITRWLSTIGLVTNDGKNIVHAGDTLIKDLSFVSSKPHRRSSGYFVGAAPPERALEALEAISQGQTSAIELMASGYRNAIYVLTDLGLILEEDDKIHLTEHRDGDLTSWLRKKAADSQSVKSVITVLNEKGKVSAKEMGHFLAEQYGFNWSESSKKRYGSALSRWARWSMGQDTQVMSEAE